MTLVESVEAAKRAKFLKQHENDPSFPLDGSDWSRLVKMRLDGEHHPHCICAGCQDLWEKLHSLDSPFVRVRAILPKALHYWLVTPPHCAIPSDESSAELGLRIITDAQDHYSNLQEVEREWLERKNKVFAKCVEFGDSKDKEKYWTNQNSEVWESRALEPRRIAGAGAAE